MVKMWSIITCMLATYAVLVVDGANHHPVTRLQPPAVTPGGPSAGGPTADCSSLIYKMSDCLQFLTVGGSDDKPEASCCLGFKQVLNNDADCICAGFRSASDMGLSIDMKKAATLPSACGVSAPSISSCDMSSPTPGASPGASPGSSPWASPVNPPQLTPSTNAPTPQAPTLSPTVSPSTPLAPQVPTLPPTATPSTSLAPQVPTLPPTATPSTPPTPQVPTLPPTATPPTPPAPQAPTFPPTATPSKPPLPSAPSDGPTPDDQAPAPSPSSSGASTIYSSCLISLIMVASAVTFV